MPLIDLRSSEKRRWFAAFTELIWRMLFIFGLMTIFLWLFINDQRSMITYFLYIAGYSGVILFQVFTSYPHQPSLDWFNHPCVP